jgi:hypothetical protein
MLHGFKVLKEVQAFGKVANGVIGVMRVTEEHGREKDVDGAVWKHRPYLSAVE